MICRTTNTLASLHLPLASTESTRGEATDSPRQDERFATLESAEIRQLVQQGCTAEDWSRVRVDRLCRLDRIRQTSFVGDVRIGNLAGNLEVLPGVFRPAGITNAILQNCSVGDNVLIHNVRQLIANYDIEERVVISDVGSLVVTAGSTFGNGTDVKVLREDGRLVVPLFDGLTSNIAALFTQTDDEQSIRQALQRMVAEYVSQVRGDRGRIGKGAVIRGCGDLTNVQVGPAARLLAVSRIANCSLHSTEQAPVELGECVVITDSIVASGATVSGGSIVRRCFVGQGVRIDDQFSAVDTLFFANSEALRGEACSAILGPYSVTHHKATLLIAVQTSFFNAGAGTSECNHAYKTGPAHFGVLDRGCKTGGASGINWPANIGASTTVLGKHRGTLDTRDFPFSVLVEQGGQTRLIPAINLTRIGPWRDVNKWRERDRRPVDDRADLIHPESLTPWTMFRMLRGRAMLASLVANIRGAAGAIEFAGVKIKPSDAQRGVELYDRAIRRWLSEHVVEQLEEGKESISPAFGAEADQDISLESWFDLGGCLVYGPRLTKFLEDIASGVIENVGELREAFERLWSAYEVDAAAWRASVWRCELENAEGQLPETAQVDAVQTWRRESDFFLKAALEDGLEDIDTAESWDTDRRSLDTLLAPPARLSRKPKATVIDRLREERTNMIRRATAAIALAAAAVRNPTQRTTEPAGCVMEEISESLHDLSQLVAKSELGRSCSRGATVNCH